MLPLVNGLRQQLTDLDAGLRSRFMTDLLSRRLPSGSTASPTPWSWARRARLPRVDLPALDVADLARGLSLLWDGLALEELAKRLAVPVDGRHSAAGDAIIAGRIYVRLVPLLRARGIDTLAAVLRFQARPPAAGTGKPGRGFHGSPGAP